MVNLENKSLQINVDKNNWIYAETLNENCIVVEVYSTGEDGSYGSASIHLDCGQIEELKAWLNKITKM